MKLFKKLAAVMLVAALALTMVGCGSAADIKSQINDYIADQAKMNDVEVTHKDALDKIAEKLLTEAGKAYKAGDDAEDLLEDEAVLKAAGIEDASEYDFALVENPDYKSDLLNSHKVELLGYELKAHLGDGDAYGLASGKIGDTNYILMVVTDAE